MKSKQLNFFITPNDYKAINNFIQEKSALVLIKQYLNKGGPIQEELPVPTSCIFQVYLTKDEFLKDVEILSTDNGISYYDVLKSNIVEFSLGGFYPYDRSQLQKARFYFIKGFYDDNEEFVNKSDDFVQWSDTVIKDFKRQFLKKYEKGNSDLYSETAVRWIEKHDAVLVNGGQQWKSSKN